MLCFCGRGEKRLEMPSACALGIFSGKNIYNFAFVAACGPLQTHFHGRGRGGKRQLPRLFPAETVARRGTNPLSHRYAMPAPPKGGAFGMAVQFLVAFDTLSDRANGVRPLRLLTAFASTSPKGRGKSTAGSFLIMPNTLATSLTAWLSPWESWRGSA